MLKRIDVLGAAKYADVAMKAIPADYVPCVLQETFGNVMPLVKRMCISSKFSNGIMVHGLWRNHKFSKADGDKAVIIAKKLQRKAIKFNQKIFYSPFLERSTYGGNINELFIRISNTAPNLILVDSFTPGAKRVQPALAIPEVHHTSSPGGKYCFSTDGEDAVNINITKDLKAHKNAFMFGMWTPLLNLKRTLDDKTPPGQRKYRPNAKYIKSLVALFEGSGPIKMKNNSLLKSHAEAHSPKNDPKANKPVFLLPLNKKRVVVRDSNGAKLAVFKNGGQFEGKIYSYRNLEKMGFQWAKLAFSRTGSYLCTVEGNTVNMGFRSGKLV